MAESEKTDDKDEGLESSGFEGGGENAGTVSVGRDVASGEDYGTFVPNFDFGMESVPIMQESSTDVAVSMQ